MLPPRYLSPWTAPSLSANTLHASRALTASCRPVASSRRKSASVSSVHVGSARHFSACPSSAAASAGGTTGLRAAPPGALATGGADGDGADADVRAEDDAGADGAGVAAAGSGDTVTEGG